MRTIHRLLPRRRNGSRPSLHTGVLLLALATAVAVLPAQNLSPHGYFESLVSRADHWRSYSLRSSAQLARPLDGGYAAGNDAPLSVTYSPSTDADPNAQDAAKVVITPFQVQPPTKLTTAISATAMTLPLSDLAGDVTKVITSFNSKGRQIKVDNEIMLLNEDVTPLDRATGLVTLSKRGAYGTLATSHAAGAGVAVGGNSLANQVRVPVASHDGATWFITWDAFFTDSFLNNGIGNYKAFQLSSKDAIWLEPQINFGGGKPRPAAYDPRLHIGVAGMFRSYSNVGGPAVWDPNLDANGPGVTSNAPLEPAGPQAPEGPFFLVHPNRWTRWWVRIEQRANDYDILDAWIADEVTGPVQVHSGLRINVRPTRSGGPPTIDEFWVEFNTSTAFLPPERTMDFRDLVAYVRNIAILRNPPADVTPLLPRPGQSAIVPRPTPPRNLRLSASTAATALMDALFPRNRGMATGEE